MQERRPPGLFIGWQGQCPSGKIFLMDMLIHHVLTWLTSSSHVAISRACPLACRSALAATPVARCGDYHGVGIDELTVRGKRGEEEKRGAPWGPIIAVSSLTSVGTRAALAEH